MGEGKPDESRVGQLPRLKVDRKSIQGSHQIIFHPKITLCQVHGYCIGGGENIVLSSDLAIASEDAVFGHPGNRLGVPIILIEQILSVGLKRANWSGYLG